MFPSITKLWHYYCVEAATCLWLKYLKDRCGLPDQQGSLPMVIRGRAISFTNRVN